MSKSRILLAGAALFTTLICWSLSSPINSHHDEKYHIASTWCAQGFNKNCVPRGQSIDFHQIVLIKINLCTPSFTENSKLKRILVARETNECALSYRSNEDLNQMSMNPNFFFETKTQIGTWIDPGHTPHLYYKIISWFVGADAEKSVIIIRVFNSLILAFLFTALCVVSERRVRIGMSLGLILTLVPHGLLTASSINTSSWSLVGCSFSWIFLFVVLNRPLRINIVQVIAIVGWLLSSTIVFFSRYDSIIYLIVTNLLIVLHQIDFGVKYPRKYLFGFVIVLLSVMALFINSLNNFRKLVSSPAPQSNDPVDLFIVIGNSLKLSVATPLRILGLQAPDWGVIDLPKLVFFSNLTIFFVLIVSLVKFDNKPQLRLIGSFLCFYIGVCLVQSYIRRDWATPFYLIRTNWSSDAFWPRYFLPLFSFFISSVAISSKNLFQLFDSQRFKFALFTLINLSQAISLYAAGETFRLNPTWYWQKIDFGIETGFVLGSISFSIFTYLVLETKRFKSGFSS